MATIKPIPVQPAVPGGFSIDDFIIDTAAGIVTCPNGITTRISAHGNAIFGAKCRGCPIRERCTTAIDGRHVKINEHHDLLAAARAHALTPEFQQPYRQHRPMVERSIALIVRQGGRKVRYLRIARNKIGFAHRCAPVNLSRLMNLGIGWDNGWTITTRRVIGVRLSATDDADRDEPARPLQARRQRRSGLFRRCFRSSVRRTTSLGAVALFVRVYGQLVRPHPDEVDHAASTGFDRPSSRTDCRRSVRRRWSRRRRRVRRSRTRRMALRSRRRGVTMVLDLDRIAGVVVVQHWNPALGSKDARYQRPRRAECRGRAVAAREPGGRYRASFIHARVLNE